MKKEENKEVRVEKEEVTKGGIWENMEVEIKKDE